MSLREKELHRSRHAQRQHEKKKQRRRAKKRVPSYRQRRDSKWRSLQPRFDDNPHKVLAFLEWCALNGFSPRTGRRIIAGEFGPGPVVTQLSPRRIGISLANNAAWQASREQVAS